MPKIWIGGTTLNGEKRGWPRGSGKIGRIVNKVYLTQNCSLPLPTVTTYIQRLTGNRNDEAAVLSCDVVHSFTGVISRIFYVHVTNM